MSCNAVRAKIRSHIRSEVRQRDAASRESRYIRTRNIGPQNWVVGVTVAYREKPRIRQTLESLREAGFSEITLFCEPGANGIPDSNLNQFCIWNKEVLGNWGNFARRTVLMSKLPDSINTKYLFTQDDVDWLPGTRQWLEENWPCNGGPASLYRSAKYAPAEGAWSLLGYGKPFLGMLAVALSRDNLLALTTNLDAMTDDEKNKDDIKFGQFCHALNIPINIANASRCQHTGVVSSLYPTTGLTKLRQANTYVG